MLQKVDRNRTVGLLKKVDDRLALARSQFKKKSFRVSNDLFSTGVRTPASEYGGPGSKPVNFNSFRN